MLVTACSCHCGPFHAHRPAAIDAAVGGWVRSRLTAAWEAKRRVVLAVDGRTLRGARSEGGTAALHLAVGEAVAAVTAPSGTRPCMAQIPRPAPASAMTLT